MNDALLKQSLKNQKVIMHGLSYILMYIAFNGNCKINWIKDGCINRKDELMAQYSETGELLYKGE